MILILNYKKNWVFTDWVTYILILKYTGIKAISSEVNQLTLFRFGPCTESKGQLKQKYLHLNSKGL